MSTLTSRLFAANGIEGSIHRMRHTFATRLLRAGVNIRVVQTLMRHRSLASTMIYTAVDEDERRDAISRLGVGSPSNRAALAIRHPAASASEDGRGDTVRYLAALAKAARDSAAS